MNNGASSQQLAKALAKALAKPLAAAHKDRANFLAFVKEKPPSEQYSLHYDDCPMTQFAGRLVGYALIPDEFRKAIFNYGKYDEAQRHMYGLTWGELAARLEAQT